MGSSTAALQAALACCLLAVASAFSPSNLVVSSARPRLASPVSPHQRAHFLLARHGLGLRMAEDSESETPAPTEAPKKKYILPKDDDIKAIVNQIPRGTEKVLQVLAGVVIVAGFANYFAFGDLPEAGTSSKMWLSGFILWFVGIALERQPGT